MIVQEIYAGPAEVRAYTGVFGGIDSVISHPVRSESHSMSASSYPDAPGPSLMRREWSSVGEQVISRVTGRACLSSIFVHVVRTL